MLKGILNWDKQISSLILFSLAVFATLFGQSMTTLSSAAVCMNMCFQWRSRSTSLSLSTEPSYISTSMCSKDLPRHKQFPKLKAWDNIVTFWLHRKVLFFSDYYENAVCYFEMLVAMTTHWYQVSHLKFGGKDHMEEIIIRTYKSFVLTFHCLMRQ